VLKSPVGSRSYSIVGRLVWSDAEGFNSHPFVCTSEPSIVEEPWSFFPVDYRLPNWEGVRVSNLARPIPLSLCCTAC
jgi:hypothetical protein